MIPEIASLGLMDDEDIELDLAALALSALDHEGIDLSPYVELIEKIGQRLADYAPSARTAGDQADALALVLGGEFGFSGDAATYDAPTNMDLVRVLDRRKGLPVSFSILYVAAARRMGWTAFALNTPGHVLVRIGTKAAVVIDPFNGGVRVSNEQIFALLSRALGADTPPRPDHVAPMSNRTVLVRLLLNQGTRAEQTGDETRATTIYERMTIAAPENADGWWSLARLQLQAGAIDAARQSLSAMLEVTRDVHRRELANAALEAINMR